jgi:pimeloyl-ACP methyl ester carboxylesterase
MTTTVQLSQPVPLEMSYDEYGAGHPFLLLHGGAGPLSVAGFATKLAAERNARVIVPAHPGFAGTPRPDTLSTVGGLADAYLALLERLDLTDVTVVGNSIGGWIAAELAVRGSSRVSSVVLVDAVGIEVAGHPVADFFALSFDDLARLSYWDPTAFRIDPTTMSEPARAAMAGNRAAIATYAGSSMADPGLLQRLGNVAAPTLVVWGDSDGIVDPDYGKAYAAAIPGAQFLLLDKTGHLPQLESPDRLLPAVWDFADRHAAGRA